MAQSQAGGIFEGVFTEGEQDFLFSHPAFQRALERATAEDFAMLNELGVKLLLGGEYDPKASARKRPSGARKA